MNPPWKRSLDGDCIKAINTTTKKGGKIILEKADCRKPSNF